MKLSERMLGYKTRVITLHSLDEDDNTQYVFIPYEEYDGVLARAQKMEACVAAAREFTSVEAMDNWDFDNRGVPDTFYGMTKALNELKEE